MIFNVSIFSFYIFSLIVGLTHLKTQWALYQHYSLIPFYLPQLIIKFVRTVAKENKKKSK